MTRNEILTLIAEWQNVILRVGGIEREYEPAVLETIGTKPIKIITGFRRSGKSFLIQRIAQKLVRQGRLPISNILYLNFEDFRLADMNTPANVDELYRLFRTSMAESSPKLLIFDEIQKVAHWDQLIRTIYEKDQDCEIILTGSNSELLAAEIGSNLAGRFLSFSILPFDFQEYVLYAGMSITSQSEFYRQQEDLRQHFNRYLKFGGLPEICAIQSEHACFSYLEGILSKVILDDIIARFQLKHPVVIEKMLRYLLVGIGNQVSFVRIASYLKQAGIRIKQETLIKYVQHIRTAFALYEVPKFDWKLGKVFATSRKYYAVDTGLVNLYPGTTSNYSKQLENVVFLKLLRRQQPIYFGASNGGKEIDFIVQTRQGRVEKYQVTHTLHDVNASREYAPFTLLKNYLAQGVNMILTLDDDEDETPHGETLIVKRNLLKWLLGLECEN